MIRRILLATALVGFTFTASACNTVKGVGQDVQSVGEAGEEAIN